MALKQAAVSLALARVPVAAVRYYYRSERRRGDPALLSLDGLVGPGDTVVDVGAYRGIYSYRLASLVGTHGLVHAFEPHPANARVLCAIASRYPQIRVHPTGLSAQSGQAMLLVPELGNQSSALATLEAHRRTDGFTTACSVRVDRLDEVIDGERSRVALIKVDVEGHELEVLRGAEGLIRRSRPVLLVEVEQRHLDVDIDVVFRFALDRGYVGQVLTPRGPRPLATFDVHRDQLRHVPKGHVGRMPNDYLNNFLFTPA